MARAPRAAFEESSVWSPPGPGVEVRRASKPVAKPQSGAFALAFRLFTVVIVVVGLVVVVGPDLAPKLGKYLPFLRSGAQSTPPPTFATYTPGPTPTDLPNYKLFTNTANGFAMDYPTSWAASTVTAPQNDTIYKFTQSNTLTVVIVERSPNFDSATNAQLIQAEIQGAQSQGMTLTQITSATTTEGAGGEIWQRQEYQATTKNGAKLHIAVLACHHLGKGYVIALISADTGFATNDTTAFEPMLRSFRFL